MIDEKKAAYAEGVAKTLGSVCDGLTMFCDESEKNIPRALSMKQMRLLISHLRKNIEPLRQGLRGDSV